MRKKSLAAVPPVYAAARNRQRRVRLCGVCLGLGVAVTACGADGHGFGGQDASEIQSVQETQESQDAGNVQDEQEAAGTQKEEEIRKQVLAEMSEEQKNWMGGLSKEQRLADFKSLCEGLRANYPYVKLAKRQAGAVLDALETADGANGGQCASEGDFYCG